MWLTGVYHKHPSFQSECEIRVAKYINNDEDELIFSKNNTIKRMFVFDIKKHGITFDELIEEIIIGPRSKQSIDELKMYIESKGYIEISKKIRVSNCPLR